MTATTVTTRSTTASRSRSGGARSDRARTARTATDGANALRLDVLDRPEAAPLPESRPVARPDRASRSDRVSRPDPAARPSAAAVAGPSAAALPAPALMPRLRLVLLVFGLVGAGVLGVLMINTRINENAFRIDDLRQRQNTLDLQEQQLNGQLAEFDSPGNLAAAARRLGLVPAGTPAYIRLPDGRVIGVPRPATGNTGSTIDASSMGASGSGVSGTEQPGQ
jgi:hypothetical protein